LWLLIGLLAFTLGLAIIVVLSDRPSSCVTAGVPTQLMALYTAAEQRYAVPWSLLAAINSIETDFGTNLGPSSAGALGPMQFMPTTWRQYGVDANRDGTKDVMDPADAIPATARLLNANGAPQDLRRALFAYNPADWYVDKVLALSTTYAAGASCADTATGDASPGAVLDAADALHAMRVPYNYGGGHMTPARPTPGSQGPYDGLDCSSSVSWVLQHAGIRVPTMDSTSFMRWGEPGPGTSVTLYTNPTHIIMSVLVDKRPRYFGTSAFGHPQAGTGPAWFTRPVSSGYLAGFVQRHPAGL
jgi:cell wall-associated NlpC family hydrolase